MLSSVEDVEGYNGGTMIPVANGICIYCHSHGHGSAQQTCGHHHDVGYVNKLERYDCESVERVVAIWEVTEADMESRSSMTQRFGGQVECLDSSLHQDGIRKG